MATHRFIAFLLLGAQVFATVRRPAAYITTPVTSLGSPPALLSPHTLAARGPWGTATVVGAGRRGNTVNASKGPLINQEVVPSSPAEMRGMRIGIGAAVWKVVKKAASGAPLLVVLLLSSLMAPGAVHAKGMVADISTMATTNFNSVMNLLAASGFLQAFSLVFVSEIGDKTFFIAGLLAMKTSRLISFSGSMAALTVMTIISVIIGQVFHAIPQSLASGLKFDQVVAVLAFAYFGLKTLKEAYEMPEGASMSGMEEEKAEAEKAVEESAAQNQATVWATLTQIFTLVFAAEFGDRSFLSTIALGAAQNPLSVASGAVAAHASATGIAVASGALLSRFLSEKLIGYIGGSLFVLFAITTALGIF